MGIRSLILVLAVGCGSSGADDATFVAWGSSTSSITLAWQAVEGATGYQLDRDGRDPVLLPADELQYLDSGLAEGSYAYHLTALGVQSKAQDAKATTSGDVALVTGDDAPIGDPITGVGVIELPMARATSPEATVLTLQAITPPVGASGVAVELSSDTAPTAAVDISFALDDTDLAAPENVAIAAKQDDGTWVTVAARLDGDHAIATLAPEAQHAFAAPKNWHRRLVKFRRILIEPDPMNVRAKTEVAVYARALYSEDPCQDERGAWFCQIATGEAFLPIPEPITELRPIKNSAGTWRLDGPGTLEVDAQDHFVTYTAPSSKPAKDRWNIWFTMKSQSTYGLIRFVDNRFDLHYYYDNEVDTIGTGAEASTHDEFSLTVDATPGEFTVVDGPKNVKTVYKNVQPTLSGTTVMATSDYEAITANSIEVGDPDADLSLTVHGTYTLADTVVTFPDGGGSVMFPGGGARPSTLGLLVPKVNFANIMGETTFEVPGTKWQVVIKPVTPLP